MSRSMALPAFDLCGPLPDGVAVLEASAGTGKTFALAALAARYVAEGCPLENQLLVTFTRMATGELRERVRERLVTAYEGLDLALRGMAPPEDDDVLQLLAAGGADQVRQRRRRLGLALSDFDGATIATTHEFCQHVLSSLGVVGDVERDAGFLEDVRDLGSEVVDDLYVRLFGEQGRPPFTRAAAREIARSAMDHSLAPVEPAGAAADSPEGMRRRFTLAVREEVERRKRRSAVLTYNDLLTRLSGTLADPGRGEEACRRLRERYRVALVDEFQDTDPVQWEVMRRAFARGGGALVLIGDPKQAIYAFRGADVYSYLDAARAARTRATLETNWRSDADLLRAYDALFAGAQLGHPDIVYRQVHAAPGRQQSRLEGAPQGAALRIRVVHRADGAVRLNERGSLIAGPSGEPYVAADLAADVARLLSAPARVLHRDGHGRTVAEEAIRPGHVAVLVRKHTQAALIREALRAAGIPAVVSGAGSVFATQPAKDWLWLLEALARPSSGTAAALAALGVFVGWTGQTLAEAGELAHEELQSRLFSWGGTLRRRGVAALLDAITAEAGLPARVLSREGGERELTDLRHVGQLLHEAAVAGQLGPAALIAWLSRRIADAAGDVEDEERARRLESDDDAVQILTIHRCKGLEFPVVYCPFLWRDSYFPRAGEAPVLFHDAANDDRLTLDVAMDGNHYAVHHHAAQLEQRGEDLRLAYVALTRAKMQAVVWWAASWDAQHSALGRLLFRDRDGTVPAFGRGVPEDAAAVARLERLAAGVPGAISVERADPRPASTWTGHRAPGGLRFGVRLFDRTLDSSWRRSSYSGIVAAAHELRVWSEPESAGVTDEPPPAPAAPAVPAPGAGAGEELRLRGVPSLWAELPGGFDVGTFVHALLEATDFTAADLVGELGARASEPVARWGLDIEDPGSFLEAVAAAIQTPLGPSAGGAPLRGVARRDRLSELDFELPLVGGDVPTSELALRRIGSLLAEHLPAGDPLGGYAPRLGDPGLVSTLRGYLAGTIDLVVRRRPEGGAPRFLVVDYKTNWLGPPGEALTAWHYRPQALAQEMLRAHYPLQALLYTVALHRYLRWRLPGYRPEEHLGGVAYLFLRGMSGPATPLVAGEPCGVLSWQPPARLIVALSDLLDRGR